MGLKKSALKIELREVDLNALPEDLLKISDTKTVPVLALPDGTVLDESSDILKWSLEQNDPDNWLGENRCYLPDTEMLIETNDFSFKSDLDHYKYADRYPEHSQQHYRQACEEFIAELEAMLSENRFLLADQLTIADIAVFPFVRQFSLVDEAWFEQSEYINVRQWLAHITSSELFQNVFQKHKNWQKGDAAVYL